MCYCAASLGRTEIITNDQNPNFTAQFALTYIFEEVQSLRLEVYDADTVYTTNNASQLILAKQDFQGGCLERRSLSIFFCHSRHVLAVSRMRAYGHGVDERVS